MRDIKKSMTIEYYDNNAKPFFAGTVGVDFTKTQNKFLQKLSPGAKILDFGCGSGRDARYFMQQGYEVEAADGSEELCRIASEYLGCEVRHLQFGELDEEEKYDGIWACASILHLEKAELAEVLEKMLRALKEEGIIYTSFKLGEF